MTKVPECQCGADRPCGEPLTSAQGCRSPPELLALFTQAAALTNHLPLLMEAAQPLTVARCFQEGF